MEEQFLVYQEDEQLYWHNHVLMAQKGQEPVDANKLAELSWQVPGAGRLSTSADAFVSIAENSGFTLRVVERREKSKGVPSEWANYPLVVGATGNY